MQKEAEDYHAGIWLEELRITMTVVKQGSLNSDQDLKRNLQNMTQ
jgi:hypothetical protein